MMVFQQYQGVLQPRIQGNARFFINGLARRAASTRCRGHVKPFFMPPVPRHRARKRLPKPDRRRALKLLAGSPTGCTEALLFAYGITVEMLVGLIEAGLARATPERVRAGSKAIEIARVRITEARRALRME